MNTRLTFSAKTRQPSLRQVFVQQLRMIDAAKRFPLLLGIIAVPTAVWPWRFELIPILPMLIAVLAWPLLVWQGEGPGQRNYHRCLPVDQTIHDLLKIAAGGVFLVLAISLTLAFLIVAALLINAPLYLFGFSIPFVISFITGTLLIYLLVSVFPLLTDRPMEWLLGTAVGLAVLSRFRETAIYDFLSFVMRGEYGLAPALFGANENALILTTPGAEAVTVPWVQATLLWFTVAISLVLIASRRANKPVPLRVRIQRLAGGLATTRGSPSET